MQEHKLELILKLVQVQMKIIVNVYASGEWYYELTFKIEMACCVGQHRDMERVAARRSTHSKSPFRRRGAPIQTACARESAARECHSSTFQPHRTHAFINPRAFNVINTKHLVYSIELIRTENKKIDAERGEESACGGREA